MQQEIRWQYRFRNFSRAYSLLSEALGRGVDDLNDLEKEGVIQGFEYTFELAWNTLKDRLEYDGMVMESVTARNVIREAVSAKIIDQGETWIDMLIDRNNMSHRFDCDLFEDVLANVRGSYLPAFDHLHQILSAEMTE